MKIGLELEGGWEAGRGGEGVRLWQIIPKSSPIILFSYSQVLSLLFFSRYLLFPNYSQLCCKKCSLLLNDCSCCNFEPKSVVQW